MNINGFEEVGPGIVTSQRAASQSRPEWSSSEVWNPRPKAGILIIHKVNTGEIPVHQSRLPTSCQDATHAMGNISQGMLIAPSAQAIGMQRQTAFSANYLSSQTPGRAKAAAMPATVDIPGQQCKSQCKHMK